MKENRDVLADLLSEKIPPYFDGADRSVVQELVNLLRRGESDLQVRALSAAVICCIEKMDRAYIEISGGQHIKPMRLAA